MVRRPCRAQDAWRRFKDKPVSHRATNPEQEVLDETRCVLAMLENQDWNTGRVLAKLAELGLAENTLVLYFSDNGPNSWRWNGGMKGRKASTDEGGVRSICHLRRPAKLPASHTVTQICGAIDLPASEGPLTLRALEIPGQSVMDVPRHSDLARLTRRFTT